ncbi:MAG: DNA-binding protein WhiA [bacterium]|nr:DNA-binding protein WhiA [bacterium]
MSFASQVKKELCSDTSSSSQLLRAELYGMMLFAKKFSEKAITFKTENNYTVNRYVNLAMNLFCPLIEKTSILKAKKNNTRLYTVNFIDENDCRRIFEDFGHYSRQINLRINWANLDNRDDMASFMRGVFLSCGSITDPEKSYHLEFSVPYKNLCEDLCRVIEELFQSELRPRVTNRSGIYVVYIKGSEEITDLLTFMGAPNSAMEIMGAKAVKQVRNNVNRRRNSEIANIQKSAAASAVQINAIEKIKNKKGLESLPDDLREIALLRLENPDMSLRSLGQALTPEISRSGVNHRIHRILQIAEDL